MIIINDQNDSGRILSLCMWTRRNVKNVSQAWNAKNDENFYIILNVVLFSNKKRKVIS